MLGIPISDYKTLKPKLALEQAVQYFAVLTAVGVVNLGQDKFSKLQII
jgi:hypothetical protein